MVLLFAFIGIFVGINFEEHDACGWEFDFLPKMRTVDEQTV